MEGAGDLKLQKMIYVRVVVSDDLSMDWINYCLPGSQKHFARLQKDGYKLTDRNQVPQVIKALAARSKIPLPVAEESVCCNLKPERSAHVFKELSVRAQDMFSCELNCHGNAVIWRLDAISHERKLLSTGGFSSGNQAHYHPKWLDTLPSTLDRPLRVRYTSDENMSFNLKVKTGMAERKKMEDEVVTSSSDTVEFKDIQVLLNKNRSLLIDVNFVADIFYINPAVLRDAIRVDPVGQGYIAFIDETVFDRKRCQLRRLKQLDETEESRLPLFGRMDRHEHPVSYKSKSEAVLSLLLHLLFNIKRKGHSSWTFNYLEQAKELVLVMPVAKNQTTCEVVGTLFRTGKRRGTRIYCRYFDSTGNARPPFEVAMEDEGRFEKLKM
jgi:hypothetical protein